MDTCTVCGSGICVCCPNCHYNWCQCSSDESNEHQVITSYYIGDYHFEKYDNGQLWKRKYYKGKWKHGDWELVESVQ